MRPGRRVRAAVGRFRASEMGGLSGDSFYAGIFQAATSLADLLQLLLITHALGLDEFGELAVAMAFVVLVGQLFDLRVGVATTIAAAKHVAPRPVRAAGVFQTSYLVDGGTGLLGFGVVVALAPFVGDALIGDGGTTLIILYALTLLAGTLDETSFTVLRLLDRFRLIAAYTTALEVFRIALVVAALAVFGTLTSVAIALVIHKLVAGLTSAVAAAVVFRRTTGVPLTAPRLGEAREDRPVMFRTMMHTNVVSYAKLAQAQLPTVVLGAVAGTGEAGLYKVGMAAATLIGRLADPAYIALLPRMARLWEGGRRVDLRQLIERLSAVYIPLVIVAAGFLIVFRDPVLDLLGAGDAAEAGGTVLALGAIAYAINTGLLWNIATLYATGRARVVARLALVAAVAQVATVVPLANAWGAEGAALAFLLSMIVLNVPATILALAALSSREHAPATIPAPESAIQPGAH